MKKCFLTVLIGLCATQGLMPVSVPTSSACAQPLLVETVKNALGAVVAKIFYVQSVTLPQTDLNPLPLKADQAALFVKQFGAKTSASLEDVKILVIQDLIKALAAGRNTSIRFDFPDANDSFSLSIVYKKTLTSSPDSCSVEAEITVYSKTQTIPVHARAFAKAAVANDAWWMKHGLKLAGALALAVVVGTGIVYRDELVAEYKRRFSSCWNGNCVP